MNLDLKIATQIALICTAISTLVSLLAFLIVTLGGGYYSSFLTLGSFLEILAHGSLALFLWTLYQKQNK